jgi:chondroitin AC lyase
LIRPRFPFLLAAACSLLAFSARGADIDIVRKNFVDYYTAAGAERTSPRMQGALGDLESQTRGVTAPGFLLSDGSWSDIDYKDTPDGSWSPWDHSRRLIIMAKAYQTPGQPYYRSAALRSQIEASLSYARTYYGPAALPLGNWWFWTIGTPLDLAPALILMRGEIDPQTYDDLVLSISRKIGPTPTGRGITGPLPTGENLVWSSYTHLCLALLKDDPLLLAQVRDAMATVATPNAMVGGEGIKPDASFHQHGAQLYTGGYGGSFANDVSRYALLTRGSGYALPAASLNAFADYIADGVAWSLYGNYFDVSVVGREVARSSTTGYNGVAALLQASQFDSPRREEIRAAAARMLQSWQWGLPAELSSIATAIERTRPAATAPQGHRHYYNSDYTVHRRANWFASVKMFSRRMKSGESTNDENILGSRQSDGRFYLTLAGDEYFGRDVWPAYDWTRLPGITVEQKPDAADATYGYGTRSCAGGTGDGMNGVSAMELAPLGSSLRANKAYFFFDDAVMFLTNGVTAPGGNRIETIVQQWPLRSSAPLITGSNYAFADGIGYWFADMTNLQTRRESRTGTWASLGGSDDATPRSATFLTMSLDHGIAPVNARAEYAIVPATTAEAMRLWAANPPLSILANDTTASAVRDRRTNATAIAFWAPGSVDGIQSNAQAVVYITDDGKTVHLYAADPNAGTAGTFRITLPGRLTSPFATTGASSTTVDIARAGGRTTHVVLTRVTGYVKRRAR